MDESHIEEIRSRLRKSVVTSPSDGPLLRSKVRLQRECAVCLDRYTDGRVLPCQHTFCLDCLQFTIDRGDKSGGFLCVLCGAFTHLEDPDKPASEWAAEFPVDPRLTEEAMSTETDTKPAGKDAWSLDWMLTIYPKSYNQSPSASKTHMKNHELKIKPTRKTIERLPVPKVVQGNAFRLHSDDVPVSSVTAALYDNDRIIVYDQGLGELLVYNETGTLQFTMVQMPVYGLSVLDGCLYMTNPDHRCIEILQLDSMAYSRAIELTMRCYGLVTMGDKLVVLLSEGAESDHVTFVEKDGVTGGHIAVNQGLLDCPSPRELAVCEQSHTMFVADEQAGVVKCFSTEGDLLWEKAVCNPGSLTMVSGHLVMARTFTNTIDVLTRQGHSNGVMASDDYDISLPSIASANVAKSAILVLDAYCDIHIFRVKRTPFRQVVTDSGCCSLL